MLPLEELSSENRELKDLCTILGVSIDQCSLRNNSIICELLERFVSKVKDHLAHEDRSIYRDLLKKHTPDADLLADHFLGNTQELKRIFNKYSRGWCDKPHSEENHVKFVEESREIFRLVCDRIAFEESKIFPFLKLD
jgi:hemerythrin superfamily protein